METDVIRKFLVTLALAVTMLMAPLAQAATTVLNFEGFANGTLLSTQYQSLAVTISGAAIADCTAPGAACTPFSGTNMALADASGIMTFTFDPIATGYLSTVSAYVTGAPGVGLYAYDSAHNLLGQALIPVGTTTPNVLLTVMSPGATITSVQIHDGGSSFSIDDFTFVTGASCVQLTTRLFNTIDALPFTAFVRNAKVLNAELVLMAGTIEKLVAQGASRTAIQQQLLVLREKVNLYLVAGVLKKNVLAAIDDAISQILVCN